MKAAQITAYGDASVVQVVETAKPVAGKEQVLVEVHAASLNPFDSSVRQGLLKDTIQLPITLGGDIAGVIVELGENVEGFQKGDKVYGQANVVAGNSGALAEYAATAAGQVAKAPSNLGFNEAGSLPLVGVSALQVITEHIGLKPGQKIFIHGGAGGIGSVAIQIAKHIGAYVATTATGQAISAVKALGADETIDYKKQNFAEMLKDFDAVFDTVGNDDFIKALSILKRGGIAVSMKKQDAEAKARALGVTVISQSTKVTTKALDALCILIEAGVVKPQIGKVFSLQDIQAAFKARESGQVSGKVVIEISSQGA